MSPLAKESTPKRRHSLMRMLRDCGVMCGKREVNFWSKVGLGGVGGISGIPWEPMSPPTTSPSSSLSRNGCDSDPASA